MKRLTTVLFLCATPVAAATIVPQFFELFVPAQVWGVNDLELMMVTLNDGRPSFRRAGDEQCLEKYDEGPVPCDQVLLFNEFEEALPAKSQVSETLAFALPDGSIFNPWQQSPVCCYGGHDTDLEPPVKVVPPVPLPATIWLMFLGFVVWFGLAILGRMK